MHSVRLMLTEHYALIKLIHIGLVFVSGGLFTLRGLLVLGGIGRKLRVSACRLSYVIDTGLLVAALLLLEILRLNPFTTPWLEAKLGVLAVYIILGSLALTHARTRSGQGLAFGAGLLCFAIIVSIAYYHDPWGFLTRLGPFR
jgi:uncharacterized membrane protein SirB2